MVFSFLYISFTPCLQQHQKKKKPKQNQQPREIPKEIVIRSLGGACGWGQGGMEQEMLL